jgi:hypothetical protein
MTIQHEPKMALGAFPAFALHGMLLIVGAVVFAALAMIHLWREWRSQRPVVRK